MKITARRYRRALHFRYVLIGSRDGAYTALRFGPSKRELDRFARPMSVWHAGIFIGDLRAGRGWTNLWQWRGGKCFAVGRRQSIDAAYGW